MLLTLVTAVVDLFAPKKAVSAVQPTKEVYLYARAESRMSSSFEHKFWFWTTTPSLYAKYNGLPVMRTKVKVDVSHIKYDKANDKYVVKSKRLQRKLISMSKAI